SHRATKAPAEPRRQRSRLGRGTEDGPRALSRQRPGRCGRPRDDRRTEVSMSEIQVHMFPCLADNYGFLVHDPDTGATAAIDTPEVEPILRELAARGWTLSYIFNTH